MCNVLPVASSGDFRATATLRMWLRLIGYAALTLSSVKAGTQNIPALLEYLQAMRDEANDEHGHPSELRDAGINLATDRLMMADDDSWWLNVCSPTSNAFAKRATGLFAIFASTPEPTRDGPPRLPRPSPTLSCDDGRSVRPGRGQRARRRPCRR